MSLGTDAIIERIRLKSQVQRWRVIAILLLIGLLLIVANLAEGGSSMGMKAGNYIARVRITGIIQDDPYRLEALQKLGDDANAKAVVLYVDSPGGTAVGGEELYDALVKLQKKKPMTTVMGNMATSAGYMISVPADAIFARHATVTGSIGVLLQSPDVSGLAEKIGVKLNTIKTDPLKGEPDLFSPISPEAREMVEGILRDFHGTFIQMIADSRKMPLEKVRSLSNGAIFSGSQAVKNGLVDAIGGEQEAVAWLEKERKIKKNLNIVDYDLEKPEETLQSLLGAKEAINSLIPKAFSINGILSIWQNSAIN